MRLYLRLLVFLKPYWPKLAAAFLCAGIVALSTAGYAWLVKPVLDDIFIRKDQFMLFILPVIILAVTVLKSLSQYGKGYLMRYVGSRSIADIRERLYERIILLPIGFHSNNATGKMISRVINDVGVMQSGMSGAIKDIFQQTVTMIALFFVIFYQNGRLAVIAILIFPFAYFTIVKMGRRLKRISHSSQERMSDLTTLLQETLSGIRIVKAFGMEAYEVRRFSSKNSEYFQRIMKGVKVSELSSPLMEAIGAVGAVAIIWAGGYEVVQGRMTPGAFFSFLTACWLLYAPVRQLGTANNEIQQALAAAERVFHVMDEETEIGRDTGKQGISSVKEAIEFRSVYFRYDGIEEGIISDINLNVKAGEVIAVVGSSGSGKTSLLNLLPRFYEPTSGSILIDGVDIRDITIPSLRGQIGIVGQETFLFDDTVRNNIAYGRVDVGMEEIISAAIAAYADQFIKGLPDGYNTMIGERGNRLSGGERQRLAIARAILKDPPILILDEATSSLDTESEYMVQKALFNLMQGRTAFVIAHRLSTIQHADKIIVIEKGRIVEEGSHEELLRRKGAYHRLYQMQFMNDKDGSYGYAGG
ncbi:MAG: lipid A export permease/ATP-binding protein MsbA [Nitrospirota bacterium]